jgi:hypothetical protein
MNPYSGTTERTLIEVKIKGSFSRALGFENSFGSEDGRGWA